MWYLYPIECYSAIRGMTFCHFQVNGWNWRTSSSAKLARLRRWKITCSSLYADYSPKTNAGILLHMGHTLTGECT
jgi:hypothetical protein